MLEQIDYKTIFHYFEEISKVPRGSYHNEKISDYLVQFAKERGIAYRQEECGNVIFRKPASADCRSGKTVMMQGHMDMVAVKTPDKDKDMENEAEQKMLKKALSKLSDREKLIISLRFGLNNREEEAMTQKEVADLLGISQSYISRLEKKIMKRLKKEMV